MSKDKESFVKSLKQVKLILGNGFDLHCGLHTKYDDYFGVYYYEKYRRIKRLYDQFIAGKQINFTEGVASKYNVNVWDIFMVVNSDALFRINNKRWCDIESSMTASFLKADSIDNGYKAFQTKVHWNEVIIQSDFIENNSDELRFLRSFIEYKRGKNEAYKDFYNFLLNELKNFEAEFGHFIKLQICIDGNASFGTNKTLNIAYVKKALETIEMLCDVNQLQSIDTFNYTDISHDNLGVPLRHINGLFDKPIFGIDSIFKPTDKEYIFTKTYRRMENDILDNIYDEDTPFENIVIFGHSLNEADYNYFFPIFDKIGLVDASRTGVVVFAYNNYEKENVNISKKIFDLFYQYALYKDGVSAERFLDSLTTQKRVLTYEIADILYPPYLYDGFQRYWDEYVKKANEFKIIEGKIGLKY